MSPRPVLIAALVALTVVGSSLAEDPPPAAPPAPAPPLVKNPKYCTDRLERRNLARRGGDAKTEAAVDRALAWLAKAQRPDGGWSSEPLTGHDPGVTGLALLALLARANVPGNGPHGDVVAKGVKYLVAKQESDGRIRIAPERVSEPDPDAPVGPGGIRPMRPLMLKPNRDVYDHAIAAQALAEVYLLTGKAEFKGPAQAAADWILKAKNPYLAWRYGYPADGSNDSSVTGWMLHALWTARAAGLDTERAATKDGFAWLDRMTDPVTGRTGYQQRGGRGGPLGSFADWVDQPHPFRSGAGPFEFGEATTAIDLAMRLLEGGKPQKLVTERKPATSRFDVLASSLPRWSDGGNGVDFYAWYWGTLATSQAGGKVWTDWNNALKEALVPHQAADGSWPPIDVWGRAGPVYSTSMACLCLESYTRYDLLVHPNERLR